MAPRGTTPLLPDDAVRQLTGAPLGYTTKEYSALISRGATHAMVEAFDMGFTENEGIGKLQILRICETMLILRCT